ncbi:MAG: hypothetical protein KDJ25_02090 [Rhodoblastus sp.]|nr:hypothetical protein [Rhodoblastus sp.]
MRIIAATVLLCASGATASACNAGKAGFAVGKPFSTELAERARIAAGVIIARRMMGGRAYTMEFRGDRLNLHTNKSRLLRVSCG